MNTYRSKLSRLFSELNDLNYTKFSSTEDMLEKYSAISSAIAGVMATVVYPLIKPNLANNLIFEINHFNEGFQSSKYEADKSYLTATPKLIDRTVGKEITANMESLLEPVLFRKYPKLTQPEVSQMQTILPTMIDLSIKNMLNDGDVWTAVDAGIDIKNPEILLRRDEIITDLQDATLNDSKTTTAYQTLYTEILNSPRVEQVSGL